MGTLRLLVAFLNLVINFTPKFCKYTKSMNRASTKIQVHCIAEKNVGCQKNDTEQANGEHRGGRRFKRTSHE